ncbi:hypothetical protein FRC00_000618 [Tulasnella sp. 408]|nr:hypothetical protein FRC00_000618 [Tulasnella sp. 408]
MHPPVRPKAKGAEESTSAKPLNRPEFAATRSRSGMGGNNQARKEAIQEPPPSSYYLSLVRVLEMGSSSPR